jgi:hypothetical protein
VNCITLWDACASQACKHVNPTIKVGVRMPARMFVGALWILIVASLVLVPKFVVSRSDHTQKETCDAIFAGFKAICIAMLIE